MKRFVPNVFFTTCALLLTWGISPPEASAQVTRGFDRKIQAFALNAEVGRQPTLWIMDVELKPVRMVWVDIKDRSTGQTKRQEVWYLVWRAINRPLETKVVDNTKAVNRLDPLPGKMQFMPQFTLVTYDDPQDEIPNQILPDQIIPEAVSVIEKIERTKLNNTVSAIQDVPEPTPSEAENQPWIYGVATWTGVDPKTDFFKIMLHGFSNGYENRSSDPQNPDLWRKVIVQRFYRPGDEFDPNLKEFQFVGDAEWTYQPDRQPTPGAN